MGSSIFFPNCPRCGKPGVAEYRECQVGAYEVFSCNHCGFGFDWETRLDEEKSTAENPVYTETMKIEKNSFKIGLSYKDGGMRTGSFSENASEEDAVKTFKELIADPEVDADRCYLSKWDAQKREVVYLFGYPELISDEQIEACTTAEQANRYANFEEVFHTKID
jgi:hypothetical protein